MDTTSTKKPSPAEAYWPRTRRLTLQLLALWFAVTFGSIFFARELSTLRFFGWPLSFYLVAQGVALFYAAIIGVYAWKMKKLDQAQSGKNDVE